MVSSPKMMAMMSMMLLMVPMVLSFDFRSPSDKITITKLGPNKHHISIHGGNPRCSVVVDVPVVKKSNSNSNRYTMVVAMPTKKLKTAFGFMEKGKSFKYMRNDPIGEAFTSFGGAGFLHPQEVTARRYGEGDTVGVTIDFNQVQEERLEFTVNGDIVGVAPWLFDQAYFAVSLDAEGTAELDVTFQWQ